MDPQPERLALVEQPEPLSIAALYRQVQAAVTASFPRSHLQWVRGEIQSISDRTGHCYMDLVDPDAARGLHTPVLKVNCWGRTWGPLKTSLGRQGIVLEPGTVVSLQGRVEFYPPKGQINFIASEVDVTALLGRLAARRAALLHTLESEGLLRRNPALAVPTVPLRIGLVASPGSEGCNDFLGQLQKSDIAFSVTLFRANVQGTGAPASVARALHAVSGADCDVAVLVRGGGSRGDLAAFDSEPVARAIATMSIPLWTGIGHTGDQSVADIVANAAFVTPTACAQELVRRVGEWWESVARSGSRIGQRAADALAAATGRDATARRRLGTATRNQLSRQSERLEHRVAQITTNTRRQLEAADDAVKRRAMGIGPRAVSVLDRQQDKTDSWRRLLAAYDIERQLERGYTITLGADGRVVRSVAELQAGSRLTTRFADGRALSTVDTTNERSTTEGQTSTRERRDEQASHDEIPVGELSYMSASRELDSIVEFFERSEVDVDQLVARLERATAIVDELDRRIRRTRAQVEDLVPKLEAASRSADVDGSGDDDDEESSETGLEDDASEGQSLPF